MELQHNFKNMVANSCLTNFIEPKFQNNSTICKCNDRAKLIYQQQQNTYHIELTLTQNQNITYKCSHSSKHFYKAVDSLVNDLEGYLSKETRTLEDSNL